MTTTTATFRDYNADNPEAGEFSVDTSGTVVPYLDRAVITQTWMDANDETDHGGGELAQVVTFDRDQARALGMRLIAWTSEDWAFMLHAEHEFKGNTGSLHVIVADGEPTIYVSNGPDFIASAEITHDMGVRLIAWAGVDVPVNANA